MIKKTDQQELMDPMTFDVEGDEPSRELNFGDSEAIRLAEKGKTLPDAVNKLVALYSYARKGYVWDFVDEYTRRPMASMVDIFGSKDLEYGEVDEPRVKWIRKRAGKYAIYNPFLTTNIKAALRCRKPLSKALYDSIMGGITKDKKEDNYAATQDFLVEMGNTLPAGFVQKYKRVKKHYKERVYKAVKGIEGFHSRAFGNEDNLKGLANSKVRKIIGLTKKDESIANKLDTRKEKRARVSNYIGKILETSGING